MQNELYLIEFLHQTTTGNRMQKYEKKVVSY